MRRRLARRPPRQSASSCLCRARLARGCLVRRADLRQARRPLRSKASQEKKLPAGEFGIKIAQYGPHKNINGDWEYTYLPIPTKLCDLCAERTEIGKLPSCVHHCEAACMEYGDMEELSKRLVEQPRSVVFSLD